MWLRHGSLGPALGQSLAGEMQYAQLQEIRGYIENSTQIYVYLTCALLESAIQCLIQRKACASETGRLDTRGPVGSGRDQWRSRCYHHTEVAREADGNAPPSSTAQGARSRQRPRTQSSLGVIAPVRWLGRCLRVSVSETPTIRGGVRGLAPMRLPRSWPGRLVSSETALRSCHMAREYTLDRCLPFCPWPSVSRSPVSVLGD